MKEEHLSGIQSKSASENEAFDAQKVSLTIKQPDSSLKAINLALIEQQIEQHLKINQNNFEASQDNHSRS